jgi:hypothetical protein
MLDDELNFYIIIGLVCFVLYFFLNKIIKKQEDKLKSYFDEVEGFSADEIHLNISDSMSSDSLLSSFSLAFAYDINNKKICFLNSKEKIEIFSFAEINETEIVVNEKSLVK